MQVLLIRNGNVGYVRLLLSCKYTVVSMYYVPSQCIRYSSVVIIIYDRLLQKGPKNVFDDFSAIHTAG